MKVYLSALCISIVFAWFYKCYVNQSERIENVGESKYLIQRTSQKSKVIMLFLGIAAMLPLTLVSAFREGVGRDFYTAYVYSYYYQMGGQGYFSDELLYDLLEKGLTEFDASYTWIFIISSFIIGICYYYSFFRYSITPGYSILLLFITNIYFIGLNGVRQGMSMSIAFLAIEKLKDGKTKTFVVLILIAAGFHKASIFYLLILLLRKIDIDVMKTFLILAFAIVGGIFVGRAAKYLIGMTQYAGYYNSIFDSDGFETAHVAIQTSVLILYTFYLGKARVSPYYEEFKICYWMQIIAVFFIFESANIPLSKRICWYMTINQLAAIPIVSKLEEVLWVKILINMIIVVLFAISIYVGVVVNGAHNVLPYNSIFS